MLVKSWSALELCNVNNGPFFSPVNKKQFLTENSANYRGHYFKH